MTNAQDQAITDLANTLDRAAAEREKALKTIAALELELATERSAHAETIRRAEGLTRDLAVMCELRDNASRAIIEVEKAHAETIRQRDSYDKRNLELESKLEWQTILQASGVSMAMGDALTVLERVRIMSRDDADVRRALDALVHSLIEQGRVLDRIGRIFGADTKKMRSVLELEEAIELQLEQHGISVIVSDKSIGVTHASIKLPTTAAEMHEVEKQTGGRNFVDAYCNAMDQAFRALLRAAAEAVALRLGEVKP